MTQRKFVKFSDICITVYVRQQLSDERMRLFADLYTSSGAGSIPPIMVTSDNKLVDGRHRMAALKFLGEDGCVCDIVDCKDSFELTMAALKANVGGSKELTMADVRQTIIRLLEEGNSQRKIIAQLPFPKEMSRKMVRTAFSMRQNQKAILAAREVMAERATLAEAAHRYGLQQRSVQSCIARLQKGDSGEVSNIGAVKGHITNRYYALTKRMGNYFKLLAQRYEAGDFTEPQMHDILAHVLHQARGHLNAMNDWNDRFDVMLKTRRPLVDMVKMPPKKMPVTGPMIDEHNAN